MSTTPEAIARKLIATLDANRAPKPGIYRGVTSGEYHNVWRAVSNSLLQHLKRSPAHLQAALEAPGEPTPAMIIGSAVHMAILEPDLFRAIYCAAPDVDKRTKAGKAELEAFLLEHTGKCALKPDDYARCIGMRDAVHRHTVARNLLHGRGDVELSFAWKHEPSGVLCKGRADRVSWDIAGGTIVDLKTTRDARLPAFEKSIFAFGYYNQGGMYVDGIRSHGLAIKHYTVIAVEKEPPYGVAVYRMKDDVIEAGRMENASLLETYAACAAANEWPGYADEVVDVGLPAWSWNQIEERIEP